MGQTPFYRTLNKLEHHFMKHRTNSNTIFRTSNGLERVHLLMIELEYPIFCHKQSNIKLRTQFDPSQAMNG